MCRHLFGYNINNLEIFSGGKDLVEVSSSNPVTEKTHRKLENNFEEDDISNDLSAGMVL